MTAIPEPCLNYPICGDFKEARTGMNIVQDLNLILVIVSPKIMCLLNDKTQESHEIDQKMRILEGVINHVKCSP